MNGHFLISNFNSEKVPSSIPKKRQELLHWNGINTNKNTNYFCCMKIFIIKNKWIYKGWGYKDSGFVTVTQGGTKLNPRYGAAFIGNRYELARSEIPHLFDWIVLNFGGFGIKKFPSSLVQLYSSIEHRVLLSIC